MNGLALLGGSFDPIHNGHLKLISEVMKQTGCERGLLLPAGVSPFKKNFIMAENQHRLNMCRLAAETIENVSVCDLEFYMPLPSYTVRTLMALKSVRPQNKMLLICGSDAFLSFDKWYKYKEILHLAVICTVARNNNDRIALEKMAAKLTKEGGRIKICEFEPVSVSSTEIRKQIRSGSDVSNLIPESVENYINENKLYRNS